MKICHVVSITYAHYKGGRFLRNVVNIIAGYVASYSKKRQFYNHVQNPVLYCNMFRITIYVELISMFLLLLGKQFFCYPCTVMLLNLTLSDPMSELVRHYDFPVPDAFLYL
jgi:hypothetical protein